VRAWRAEPRRLLEEDENLTIASVVTVAYVQSGFASWLTRRSLDAAGRIDEASL
jgi:hypothetical protein